MNFEFDDDIDLGPEDEIMADDDIRRGDIVRFERGGGPGSIRFTRLR